MNPFKYGCTVRGDYFCPRPLLQKELASRIESGQNVVIQGERRTGKTSLVLETVRSMKGVSLFNADFLGIRDVAALCNRLVGAFAKLETSDGWFAKALRSIGNLRPTVSINPSSGEPTISVDTRIAAMPTSLESVLDLLVAQTKKKRVCVVFDEFQDILDIEGGDEVLAVLRSRMQLDPDTPYVFLGSVRNRMTDIFWSPKSPFFHSAAALKVGNIDDDDFYVFLKGRFATGRRKFSRALYDQVSLLAHKTPGFVQEFCDALWQISEQGEALEARHLDAALTTIFAREQDHYVVFVKRLTALQAHVLKTIAILGGKSPYSERFLEMVGKHNASSVKKALTKLEREDLIYQYEDECRFVNPFFGEWVRRMD